jgi:hypothetical protein
MLKYCELIADRLLEAIVPRFNAGACACPDGGWYCSSEVCYQEPEGDMVSYLYRTNCHCQVIDKWCNIGRCRG